MDSQQALTLLRGIQSEIEFPPGVARTEDFGGLRAVDAKLKETRIILSSVSGLPDSLVKDMDSDANFEVNSRRVRQNGCRGRTVICSAQVNLATV